MRSASFRAEHQVGLGRWIRAGAIVALVIGLVGWFSARAATPPTTVNYQGVLRDQNDAPLSGDFNMTFLFWDAATAGNMFLIDFHTTVAGGPVTVTGGLFNVALGSGHVQDGPGPGTYTSLDEVFRDNGTVWLEVQVGTETLSPRTPFNSAAYALNATNLDGHPDTYFLDTSATRQEKAGPLVLSTNNPNFVALDVSSATEAVFAYSLGTAMRVQSEDGNSGVFDGAFGVYSTCSAVDCVGVRGFGAYGVWGNGLVTGGRFQASNGPEALLGTGSSGISVTGGNPGGYFETTTTNAQGIVVSAPNPGADGVVVSAADRGVQATGNNYGGHFTGGAGPTGVGVYGSAGDKGVSGQGGTFGGYFAGTLHGVYANGPDHGVDAHGGNYAGWFDATGVDSYGLHAQGLHTGVRGFGGVRGGYFQGAGGANSAVGLSTYKILGTGLVSFVQNHPTDPSKVIVYAAPEGDEGAVYTRGSGKLVNGQARVKLGETFALVANPDIGLTATATPRGEPIPLAVSEIGTDEVVVRGPAGSNAEFDYMVWGLRIGFEKVSVVQPKQDESKIPSMYQHEQFFRDDPDLVRYTALARFKGMDEAVRGRKNTDLSRSEHLRDGIGVFQYQPPEKPAEDSGRRSPAAPAGAGVNTGVTTAAGPIPAGGSDELPTRLADRSNEDGKTLTPAAGLDLFATKGVVELGDVVSLVADAPGSVARSTDPADALVLGCAQTSPGDSAAAAPVRPGPGQVIVATSHVALCRVDASNGAIAVGDRLTASAVPGLAMRADPAVAGATILGRAIDPLPSGDGLVRVLVGAR